MPALMALPPPPGRTDEIGLNIGGPVDSTEWHYLDTANAQQAVHRRHDEALLAAGSIHQATYVWNEAMPAVRVLVELAGERRHDAARDALGRVLISELMDGGRGRGESYKK